VREREREGGIEREGGREREEKETVHFFLHSSLFEISVGHQMF